MKTITKTYRKAGEVTGKIYNLIPYKTLLLATLSFLKGDVREL